MKNVANMIGSGNLSARERFILLIQNDIHKGKTGKEILSEADKAALENWKAKTNAEAQEWNTLNEGWMYSGRMGLEAELFFHDAQAAYLQERPLLMELLKYPLHRELRRMVANIKNLKKVNGKQAQEIVDKQRAVKLHEGMDYEYVVYRLAFERLNKEDQKRMKELYADVETDHQYLDQEEVIAHLLNRKEVLTKKAKEKLATLISEQSYNKFAKEYQLFHYFACIPLAEVARHFLESKGVSISGRKLAKDQQADEADEVTHKEIHKAVEHYAVEHKMTVEAILKAGFIYWYDAEGFVYTPLIVSKDKKLFEQWLKTKGKARKELQQLVDAGTLTIRERTSQESHKEKLRSKGLYEDELMRAHELLESIDITVEKHEIDEKMAFEKFSDAVITGNSLYKFQTDLKFVKNFQERADAYDPNLGIVYAENDPEHKGEHLDQELLICSMTNTGQPDVFSMFGLSMRRIELSLEGIMFFEDEERDGKMHLKFKNKGIERMFRESRALLMAGYAKILAHKELLKKLSRTYEADLEFRVDEHLRRLDEYIEQHNEALKEAQYSPHYAKMDVEDRKVVSVVDPKLSINKGKIKSDPLVVEEHTEKLKDILRDL